VSRVINNSLPVDAETRRRVEAAIEKVNYTPNLLARGLRMRSGHLIGLVIPDLSNQTFSHLIDYGQESALQHGYDVIVGITNNDADAEERFIKGLLDRNVDGVIFSRVSDRSHVLRMMDRKGVPFVVLDRSLQHEQVPTVVLDNERAGKMAAEHLLSLGHRELACITGPLDIAIVRDRFGSFRETVAAGGGTLPDSSVYEGDFSYRSGEQGVQKLLSTGSRFSALWALNDYMAVGALNALRAEGLRVPEDVSLVGLDNVDCSWMSRPQLTTIEQPFRQMCAEAVSILVSLKAGEPPASRRVVLEPALVVRGTTAAAATRDSESIRVMRESEKKEV
jgi:DNA-binding LacI/PurR family transcriptional regulator